MTLTAKRLRSLLDYDPRTGDFRWKHLPGKGRWRGGKIAGCRTAEGYWHIRVDGGLYLAHRLAWLYVTGKWPRRLIDHRNFHMLDNRFCNLREATDAESAQNRRLRKDNVCGKTGVHWHKHTGRWTAKISANRKTIYLGYFKSAEEASAAYRRAAPVYHGEFVP